MMIYLNLDSIDFRIAIAMIFIALPISFGFLFKDQERDNAKGLHKLYIAWCKGAFLFFFILGPIIGLLLFFFFVIQKLFIRIS